MVYIRIDDLLHVISRQALSEPLTKLRRGGSSSNEAFGRFSLASCGERRSTYVMRGVQCQGHEAYKDSA